MLYHLHHSWLWLGHFESSHCSGGKFFPVLLTAMLLSWNASFLKYFPPFLVGEGGAVVLANHYYWSTDCWLWQSWNDFFKEWHTQVRVKHLSILLHPCPLCRMLIHLTWLTLAVWHLCAFSSIRNQSNYRSRSQALMKWYSTITIGESLFTLFASLTYASHYLMTLIK